jgi:hypothetical protein
MRTLYTFIFVVMPMLLGLEEIFTVGAANREFGCRFDDWFPRVLRQRTPEK